MSNSLPALTADKYLDASKVATCPTGKVMAFPAPTGDGFVLTCVAADGALAAPKKAGHDVVTVAFVGIAALALGVAVGMMVD